MRRVQDRFRAASGIRHPSLSARPGGASAAALLFAALALALAGCGGDSAPEYPALVPKLPDPSRAGSVSGTILFEGTPPRRNPIDLGDPWCREANKAPLLQEAVVVVDGRLRDVLVAVKSGLEAFTFDYDRTEAQIDQKGCAYVPHVLAVRTYQPVVFRSSDGTGHNINTSRSRTGQGFNRTLTGAGDKFVAQFKKPELNLPALSNIHPWMNASIHVLEHPYFQVTRDDGKYELKGLPEGEYVLEAVHPELGMQEAKVKITAGAVETRDFSFRKK